MSISSTSLAVAFNPLAELPDFGLAHLALTGLVAMGAMLRTGEFKHARYSLGLP